MNLSLLLILFEHDSFDCHADHVHVQGSDCLHLSMPWNLGATAIHKP